MSKRILFLSYFYPPDLSAGSFRSAALVKVLRAKEEGLSIDVVTTQPNRYQSFVLEADVYEEHDGLHIQRLLLPENKGGLLGQAWSFLHFAWGAYRFARRRDYSLVFATSSRLMTAVLGALLAWDKRARLYLDIRDIFVETLAGVFSAPIWRPVVWSFGVLERWALKRAEIINLVSPGFLPYFKPRYPKARFSFFSNGVDAEFAEPLASSGHGGEGKPLKVVYAGNIGDGQGLHNIVPLLAEQLQERIQFQIIGDGRLSGALREALTVRQLKNVEVLPPMPRNQIKAVYEQADILFLHLNDLLAFKRVLPSKLFEYAATGKPIWAGVSGYAAEFIAKELSNAAVFPPCDVTRAVECFGQLSLACVDRKVFVERYARERIMQAMGQEIMTMFK